MNNKSNRRIGAVRLALAVLAGVAALPAQAVPVSLGNANSSYIAADAPSCPSGLLTSDRACDFPSPDGAAGGSTLASGGVRGTPGYTGLPGSSVYVDAGDGMPVPSGGPRNGRPITWRSDMDYDFVVNGPGNQVAGTVISQGLAEPTGDRHGRATFTIRDAGSVVGITAPSDLNEGQLYAEHASVHRAGDSLRTVEQSWDQSATLCVTPGDLYLVTIPVVAYSNGRVGKATARIDPRITVDRPAPVTCTLDGPLSAYGLDVGEYAFTGLEHLPEPSTFVLAALGLALIGLARWSRRRG